MKQKKPQLSIRPLPKPKISLEDPRLKDFIQAADFPSVSGSSSINKSGVDKVSAPRQLLPWEKENIRPDISKVFNLRLPETYYAKLEYLSQNSKDSKHKILMDIILPEIDKKIRKIIGDMI